MPIIVQFTTIGFISDILGDVRQYHDTLTQWVEKVTPKGFKWINCYNSKKDGWSMEDFHERCDKRGPTISLFKVREDAIFGGFTSASWGGIKKFQLRAIRILLSLLEM